MPVKNLALVSPIVVMLWSALVHAQEVETPQPLREPLSADVPATPAVVLRPTGKRRTVVGLRMDGAWAPRKLFDMPLHGGDAGLALGFQTSRHFAVWIAPRLFLGSTENGLSTWAFRIGIEPEFVFDRFRFGFGVGNGWIGVHRAARDETITTGLVEARAFVRFDLVQSEDFALFLKANLDGAAGFNDDATFWGPSLGAGVDFDLGGRRAEIWPPQANSGTSAMNQPTER